MDKTSSENIPCTYCGKDALKNTNPPVCEEHILECAENTKHASGAKTLKQLDVSDV